MLPKRSLANAVFVAPERESYVDAYLVRQKNTKPAQGC